MLGIKNCGSLPERREKQEVGVDEDWTTKNHGNIVVRCVLLENFVGDNTIVSDDGGGML